MHRFIHQTDTARIAPAGVPANQPEKPLMLFDHLKESAGPEQRHRVWSKLRILVAAIGTLGAATGIAIAVFGLVQFDNHKVIAGVVLIVVSTVIYVSILARDRNRVD